MAIEDGQLVAAGELQLMDTVGIAMGSLDALDGAVVDEGLDFLGVQLIAGEPGVVVDHDVDVQSSADVAEVLENGLLMRVEIEGQDDHDAVSTVILSKLAHLDGVEGVVTAGAADQRNLTSEEAGDMSDDLALLFHVHGDVLTGGAADGDGLCAVVEQPSQILFHAGLVVGLIGIPDRHAGRAKAVSFLVIFHCVFLLEMILSDFGTK